MTQAAVADRHPRGRALLAAAVTAIALAALPPALPPAFAAGPPPPHPGDTGAEKPGADLDLETLKERLKTLGEAIRNAIEDASRAMRREEDELAAGRGGVGALAPQMHGRDVRSVYGPRGPTPRSVEALLNYRLVLLGNERLAAGRIFERDSRIIAEVVTAKEKALVARYMIDKNTGVWVPER